MTLSRPWAVVLFAVLFISLAANLLIAGFVAARVGGPPKPPNLIERIVAFGIRGFPPSIQDSIKEQTQDQREELRALVEAAQDARMRMFDAMRADPYDPAALEAAFVDLQTRTTQLQRAGQRILAEAVAAAPPDVRARIRPPRGPFP